MIGLYFSGTGNSKYCLTCFLKEFNKEIESFSIESDDALDAIKNASEIIFAYPVQYSNIPKIVDDFIIQHHTIWKGKKIFIIATMGLFSGDGSGVLARLLKGYGAQIVGGIHVQMPDSICDEAVLKKSLVKNQEIVRKAKAKMIRCANAYKEGNPTQVGLSLVSHMLGLFGQRLYFRNKTREYSSHLRIDEACCIGCAKCVSLCPMHNIKVVNHKASGSSLCTMCYRCVNNCPTQAITLLGKKVTQQGTIETYL